MELNPLKCVFGVGLGKFLGFIVLERGIEASLEKNSAILNMKPPKYLNDTQHLVGRVVAMNRFVSRSTDKCLPFFRGLRKVHPWNDECDEAFKKLKQHLTNLPLLRQPIEGDVLYTSLMVSPYSVLAVLVKEEVVAQLPVYYISRALRGANVRYLRVEMLAFALVTVARILRPYFQAHSIKVHTESQLIKVLQRPNNLGRLVGWSVELCEFNIEYLHRKAMKGWRLADFVTKFSEFPLEVVATPTRKPWTLFVDTNDESKDLRFQVKGVRRPTDHDTLKHQ